MLKAVKSVLAESEIVYLQLNEAKRNERDDKLWVLEFPSKMVMSKCCYCKYMCEA